ncbi:hypothetical protein BDV26DRAFT_194154 [Aspergillus bertholletiae]|uniref:Uncharacterized protein n=1 Tax=Aspergillus bertholletiae TaxID=1226010 RepID=A0A5N7BMC4_9EURO|nr:hypothetical protein BDV26DRAFT_194154 [Aspergillus bertholletiae]
MTRLEGYSPRLSWNLGTPKAGRMGTERGGGSNFELNVKKQRKKQRKGKDNGGGWIGRFT